MRRYVFPAVAPIVALTLLTAACAEREPVDETPDVAIDPIEVQDDPGRTVETYLRSLYPDADGLAYAYGTADLNDDEREEYFVYLSGQSVCGTDGCNLLVLEPAGDGFRKIGSLAAVNLPVGTLATSSQGYRDIGVTVGGGLETGVAKIPFQGGAYAANMGASAANTVGALDLVIIPESDLAPLP